MSWEANTLTDEEKDRGHRIMGEMLGKWPKWRGCMGERKKVLVVDDEQDLIETLRYRMEASDMDICTAKDGIEGIEMAKAERPDLILLDIMMPRMDGYQACRFMKNDKDIKDIPVIFLSAKGQDIDKKKGREAGCDGFIVKPFEGKSLIETIRGYFKK